MAGATLLFTVLMGGALASLDLRRESGQKAES
jgi:hypothetical protein